MAPWIEFGTVMLVCAAATLPGECWLDNAAPGCGKFMRAARPTFLQFAGIAYAIALALNLWRWLFGPVG